MGYQALAFGALMIAFALGALFFVRRAARAAQRRIESKLAEANMKFGVMVKQAGLSAERAKENADRAEAASELVGSQARSLVGFALTNAASAGLAARRAENASDRSVIASEAAAQHADNAHNRARESRMWARMAGAVRARPIELRRTEPKPETGAPASKRPRAK